MMKAWIHPALDELQAAACGLMIWRIFSWHNLGSLVPAEHRLNAKAHLSIVTDHVQLFF